jgi:hypothetical protein
MKKLLLLVTLFGSYVYAGPTAWEHIKDAADSTAEGAFKTITSKSFWKSTITSTAAFNSRFFFPGDSGSFSVSSLFGNTTLRCCLLGGFSGSVLNRALPDRFKRNSAIQVALEHPFLTGIFSHAAYITTKTYWHSWNTSMKDNPSVWLLGLTGSLLAYAWTSKKLTRPAAHISNLTEYHSGGYDDKTS